MSNPNDPFAPMHAVQKNEDSLWPDGILYYVLDSSLNGTYIHHLLVKLHFVLHCYIRRVTFLAPIDQARSAIQAAMDDYTTHTCIRFQQRTNQDDYVRFIQGSG